MAQRRMFSKTIIDSDNFTELPLTAQALYFHLAMSADDDGFLNGRKRIQKVIGASEDDFNKLLDNGFIISFDSGVVVIRHWQMHNYIQKDRYKPTTFREEAAQLCVDNNGVYNLCNALDTECIQDVSKLYTQVSIGKDRVSIDKERASIDKEREDKERLTQERLGVWGKGNNFQPQNGEFSFESLTDNLIR